MAIRNSCGEAWQKAVLRANTKSATNLPEVVPACQASLRGERIAAPVCALARNDMQKEGRVRGCKNVWRARCAERGNVSAGAWALFGSTPAVPGHFADT